MLAGIALVGELVAPLVEPVVHVAIAVLLHGHTRTRTLGARAQGECRRLGDVDGDRTEVHRDGVAFEHLPDRLETGRQVANVVESDDEIALHAILAFSARS